MMMCVATRNNTGTQALAENDVPGLGTRNGVLLPNHGTLVVGTNMDMALLNCHLVEKSAHIYILAKSIGTPHIIPMDDILAMQEFARNQYGQKGD